MTQLTRQRLRLAVDTARFDQVKDVRTAAAPILWRGNDAAFEIGLFRGADLLDAANFDSMTLEVKTNDASGITSAPLMSRTVFAADLTAAPTAEHWADETQQHALFAFTAEETALDLDGELEKIFYLILSGLTTDAPTRRVTFGYALLKVKESGALAGTLPPLTAATGLNFRLKNGNELQLRDSITDEWRSLFFENGGLKFGPRES